MKSIKVLLLAALSLMAFSALVGSAAALTITSPAAGTSVTFTSTHAGLTGNFGTITCTSSSFLSTIANTTGTTITNLITTLTYSGCGSSISGPAIVNVRQTTGGACTSSQMSLVLTSATTGDIDLAPACLIVWSFTTQACTITITKTTGQSTLLIPFTWSNTTQTLDYESNSVTYDSTGEFFCGPSATNGALTGAYVPNTTVTVDA